MQEGKKIFSQCSWRQFWKQNWRGTRYVLVSEISFFWLHPTNFTYKDNRNLQVSSIFLKIEEEQHCASAIKRNFEILQKEKLFYLNTLKTQLT